MADPSPDRGARRGQSRDGAWAFLAIAAALGLALWMRGFGIDDALISIRYARHLADGTGYRFNVDGPSTDGVTPLPWPFLLAPLARASALVVLARAEALALAAWLFAAGAWGVAIGRSRAHLVAKVAAMALLAIDVPVAAHAVSGMETGVALALATLASIATNEWSACMLAGLVAAFRPEMAPWAIALAIGVGPMKRAIPRAIVAATPFATCALVRLAAFGHPAPLAVMAKPSDLGHGLAYGAAAALVSLAPIAALAPLALLRARDRSTAIATAGLVHFATVVAVGGDWMPYGRLVAPIVPSLLYAFVLASPRMSRAAAIARVVLAASLGVYELVVATPAGRHVDANMAALVAAARPHLAGARRVAALDIGWPTAASEASIVDLAGLTDPEIAALPGGHTSKRVDAAMLLARDPDVILLYAAKRDANGAPIHTRVVEARLAASELIARKYETRAFLPYGENGAGYVILKRRD